MQGESPLSLMRPTRERPRRAPVSPRRRRLWPVLLPVGAAAGLAVVWTGLWYYAAAVADSTLAGWVEREAAVGRSYSCAAQDISGFPFRIQARCTSAAAKISSSQPPFAVTAEEITFTAPVYHPTVLVGRIGSPLTLAELGQTPSFVANWSRAELTVRGLPPDPDGVSAALDRVHVDHVDGTNNETVLTADNAELDARVIAGSPSNNPVISAVLKFKAATAPTIHPLLAEPLQGEIQAELHGFKDLAPKSWADRFREMQAAGGSIQIKSLRIDRSDATVVGTGTLTVNEHGKLDGLIRVAIVGVERIVPLLGIDKAINKGIDRLTGAGPQPAGTPSALDRLVPGLGNVVRDTANASLIDNVKKMGQPTEIDNKPAVLLPLRFADGSVYLGLLPLGEVPALF